MRAYTLTDKDGSIVSFGNHEGKGDTFTLMFMSRDKAMAVGEQLNANGALNLMMKEGEGPFATIPLRVEGMTFIAGPIDGPCPSDGEDD